jgi:hypothetical protein
MTNVITMPKRKMTRTEAVKEFFGTAAKPVKGEEIITFMRQDKTGFQEIGDQAIEALGAERKEVS